MGLYRVKPAFQRTLRVFEDGCVEWGIPADALTISAVGVSGLAGLMLTLSHVRWPLLLVPPLILVRLALNTLDGLVARRTNTARPWGLVLNELCDRLSDMALLVPVVLCPVVDLRLGLGAVATVLLSSLVGVLGQAAGGARTYAGIMGKGDRMALLAVFALLVAATGWDVLWQLFTILLLGGAVLTVAQRLEAIYVELNHAG